MNAELKFSKDEVLNFFKAELKPLGFNKKGQKWKKNVGKLSYIIKIENSQFDNSMFYLTVGIIINNDKNNIHNANHLSSRISHMDTLPDVLAKIFSWFEERETIEKIIKIERNNYGSLFGKYLVENNYIKTQKLPDG